MALSYGFGSLQWLQADAATTNYVVSSLSFQPKALRFFTCGIASSTDAGSSTQNMRRCVGFATSTSYRRAVATQSIDAAADATCTTGYRDDCCVLCVISTPATAGRLDLTALASNGFTLTVDEQLSNAAGNGDITVFWEAWGGSDITVAVTGEISEPAATGDQDYTVTGFVSGATDQVVMFGGIPNTGAANATPARTDSGWMTGAAGGGVAAGDNIVLLGSSDDASGNMDTDGYALDGECLAMIVAAGGNPNARATLTAFGTDNFRLNWAARALTARKYIFLAIKGGSWKVGSGTINVQVLNSTMTVSGLSFAPKGVSVITAINAENAAGTSNTEDIIFVGMGTSTTSRQAMSMFDTNGGASAAIVTRVEYDQIVSSTGASYTLDLNQMNSDGFQLITDLQSAGEPTNAWVGYMTFGDAPVAGATTFPGYISPFGWF